MTQTNETRTPIYGAILEAQKAIAAIATKKHPTQNFDYMPADQIVAASRDALQSAGLVIVVSSRTLEHQETIEETTAKGPRRLYRAIVGLSCMLVHAESVSVIPLAGLGEGLDYGDKAISKAETYALKSILSDLLMLSKAQAPANAPKAAPRAPRPQAPAQAQAQAQAPKAAPKPQAPAQAKAPGAQESTADKLRAQYAALVKRANDLNIPARELPAKAAREYIIQEINALSEKIEAADFDRKAA